MNIYFISLLVLLSAICHIQAEYAGVKKRVYICKPFTMAMIILIALIPSVASGALYQYLIIAGLIFSLAGDIFLMFPETRFTAGLFSFLIGHVFYIFAFSSGSGFGLNPWFSALLVSFGVTFFSYLSANLGKMKLPVALYILVILLMGSQAFHQWQFSQNKGTWFAFIGALLFILSDSILAANKFRTPFKTARFFTLSTYFTGQYLIALSVGIR